VDGFTALLTMLDFIDNEMPKLGSIAELRAALSSGDKPMDGGN